MIVTLGADTCYYFCWLDVLFLGFCCSLCFLGNYGSCVISGGDSSMILLGMATGGAE